MASGSSWWEPKAASRTRLVVRKPNSEVYGSEARGTLEFNLLPGGYEWELVSVEESVFSDSGSGACH